MKLNKNWKFKEIFPTISAHTTAYNCITGNYPFIEAIKSFYWCDEVIVVDGGSTDGTREKLEELGKEMPNLQIHDIPIDWDDPGKDGQLKAMSRAMTSCEYVIQFDADEIAKGSIEKWKKLIKGIPKNVQMLEMFVYEPIGSKENLRLNPEHNNCKWRISKNKPEYTYGIPDYDRFEKDGKVYSKGMSDGCFPINIVNNKLIPSIIPEQYKKLAEMKRNINKIEDDMKSGRAKDYLSKDGINDLNEEDVENMKKGKLTDCSLFHRYRNEVQNIIENDEPYILHLGHLDLKNKIKLYLSSWKDWWNDLYGKDGTDFANNIYFPNVPYEDVDEQMIDEKVKEIIKGTLSVEIDYE